ncbi:RNA-directed DNA polymerase, eukaryota [Tanacetum coccineum]
MEDLDCAVSRDEIRRAVWSCGENKSPGPDGYTFEFFRKYWRFIGPDFCVAVEHFFVTGLFPRGCNSSFIALIPKVTDAKFVTDFRPISLIGCIYKVITKVLSFRLASVISDLVSETQSAFVTNRQILDGPFILNEILNWKWCRWIGGIFSASMASILVNGSPTSEFQFFRGLKQGDPLAPYLFILIMESLHISFSRAVNDGFFKGIRLHGSVTISHLFYPGDAMFVGEWSDSNLLNIVNVLNCFFLESGLKINIHKSQLLGVGVLNNVVVQAIYGPRLELHMLNISSNWCSILREYGYSDFPSVTNSPFFRFGDRQGGVSSAKLVPLGSCFHFRRVVKNERRQQCRHLPNDPSPSTMTLGSPTQGENMFSHPSPEDVKAKLAKIVTNASYLDKTPVLKNFFPMD